MRTGRGPIGIVGICFALWFAFTNEGKGGFTGFFQPAGIVLLMLALRLRKLVVADAGHLDAHHALAGDGGDDAHTHRLHGHGEIVRERDDVAQQLRVGRGELRDVPVVVARDDEDVHGRLRVDVARDREIDQQ